MASGAEVRRNEMEEGEAARARVRLKRVRSGARRSWERSLRQVGSTASERGRGRLGEVRDDRRAPLGSEREYFLLFF